MALRRVLAAEPVGGIDDDLAAPAGDACQRVRDGAVGNGEQHDVGAGDVAAVAPGPAEEGPGSSPPSALPTSPPSRPSSVTSCPAALHSRPSVPPMAPLPM